MKKTIRINGFLNACIQKNLLFVFLIIPLLLSSQNHEDEPEWLNSVIKKGEKYINKTMKRNNVTGLSIALVDDQKILWAQGFGYADKENDVSATEETVYRVASISKLFTSIAVMQLHEKEIIHIDSPYQKYVPEFSIRNFYADDTPITPRNMMTHHSGLPNDYYANFTTRNPVPYQSIIPELQTVYKIFPSDYIFSYSNIAFSLLGYMVEQVSGMPFEQYVEEHILQPLTMSHSSFELPEHIAALHSKGYERNKEYFDPYIREKPAVMLVSNATDLAKFIQMVFAEGEYEGNRIIQRETLEEMTRVQNENIELDLQVKIGLCWFLNLSKDMEYAGSFMGHDGDTKAFHAALSVLQDHKLGVVVLTNSTSGLSVRTDINKEIIRLALEAKAGLIKPEKEKKPTLNYPFVEPSQKKMKILEGNYATSNGNIEIKAKKNYLKTKLYGKKITLMPNQNKSFTPRVHLMGLIPLPFNRLEYTFDSLGNTIVLVEDRKIVYAEKVPDQEITETWMEREAYYELDDPGDNIIFTYDKAHFFFDKGVVYLNVNIGDVGKQVYILKILNDHEAISYGMGRGMRETVQFLKDDEGKEYLKISGYKLYQPE
jgi:CubicO group peptidase (beta-lactamase class C family)